MLVGSSDLPEGRSWRNPIFPNLDLHSTTSFEVLELTIDGLQYGICRYQFLTSIPHINPSGKVIFEPKAPVEEMFRSLPYHTSVSPRGNGGMRCHLKMESGFFTGRNLGVRVQNRDAEATKNGQ